MKLKRLTFTNEYMHELKLGLAAYLICIKSLFSLRRSSLICSFSSWYFSRFLWKDKRNNKDFFFNIQVTEQKLDFVLPCSKHQNFNWEKRTNSKCNELGDYKREKNTFMLLQNYIEKLLVNLMDVDKKKLYIYIFVNRYKTEYIQGSWQNLAMDP